MDSPLNFPDYNYAFQPRRVVSPADPVVTLLNVAADLILPWQVDSTWLSTKKSSAPVAVKAGAKAKRAEFVLSPIREGTIFQRRVRTPEEVVE